MKTDMDLNLYKFFGVELPKDTNGSGQVVADCPFCGHPQHFYIDRVTGQFRCMDAACGVKGNKYSFLSQYYDAAFQSTRPFSYRRLSARRRHDHQDIFSSAHIAYDHGTRSWLIPVNNAKGGMVNLLTYRGEGPTLSAPGCKQHLIGLDELQKKGPVLLVEGPFDRASLLWLLRKCKDPDTSISVLAVPGADYSFKNDLDCLTNRNVYLLYDNDDAGANGMKTASRKIAAIAKSTHLLVWPPDRFPAGYDIDDLVRDGHLKPDDLLEDILSWCYKYKRGADPGAEIPELVRNTVDEVLVDFEKTKIHVSDALRDCLTITLAAVTATRLDGESIWLYIVGDSGAGKSLILESTLGSEYCLYRTSITSRSFISGFRSDGPDNSLLALIPGRSLIVKDYSNVLALAPQEQDQLVGILRDAFDGKISKNFGNKLHIEYPLPGSGLDSCRFSFIAGVTKRIHTKNHVDLGERFLKYEIPRLTGDDIQIIRAALGDDSWKAHENQLQRAASVAAFLGRDLPKKVPTLDEAFLERLVALVQFIELCRAPVSRTGVDLDYAPTPEFGGRLAKQLKKLSQSLCITLNVKKADDEVYRLIRDVAWHTAHGWRRTLYGKIYELGPVSLAALCDETGFSHATAYRQTQNMFALGLIKRGRDITGKEGRPKPTWLLTTRAKRIYNVAKIGEI